MGNTKYLSAFEQGMVVGARCTSLCKELQLGYTQQFPLCIKNGPTPKGHPANMTQLWEALESTWASIPVERLSPYTSMNSAPAVRVRSWSEVNGLAGLFICIVFDLCLVRASKCKFCTCHCFFRSLLRWVLLR